MFSSSSNSTIYGKAHLIIDINAFQKSLQVAFESTLAQRIEKLDVHIRKVTHFREVQAKLWHREYVMKTN